MEKLIRFLKRETVLTVSGAAALCSAFLVPPSGAYLAYPDYRVLALLFCLMAVVAGLSKTGLFGALSRALLSRTDSLRAVSLILVLLCFFSSIFITNDVSLLTFVPLAISLLSAADPKRMRFVVVMQTVAANLGSMLTPVGNPQNLYLYARYGFGLWEFLALTAPVVGLSLALVVLLTLWGRGGRITAEFRGERGIKDKKRLLCYLTLFALCLVSVFGALDYRALLGITVLAVFFCDRTLFRKVDYALLMTFVFFFLFVGNLGALPSVRTFLSGLIGGRELPAAILLSQCISNVPAAMMLSAFTENGAALVLGTDIGGLGTLVASLASLISYKLYTRGENSRRGAYLLLFSAVNFSLLAILTAFALLAYR